MSSAPYRDRAVGTRHMVSSGHHLATTTAFQILEAGGNAIDAGVAGSLVLSVVQSDFVGFGGVAPISFTHLSPAAKREGGGVGGGAVL